MQKRGTKSEADNQSPSDFFDSLGVHFSLRCTENDEDATAFLQGFRYGLTTLHRMLGAAFAEANRAGQRTESTGLVSLVEKAVTHWNLDVHFKEINADQRQH